MSDPGAPNPDLITTVIVPVASRGVVYQIFYTCGILVVLTFIWTGLRFYSRHMRRVAWTVEDFLYIFALVLFYAFVVVHVLNMSSSSALPFQDASEDFHLEKLMKYGFASQVIYAFSLGSLKISICLMLQRIFFVKKFKIAAWCTMAFAACWMAQTILICFLICRPLEMNWNPLVEGGKCGNQTAAFASVGVVDLIVDTVILILPLPMVFSLHLSLAHRLGLACIFGVGILTCVFAGLRLNSVFLVDFNNFSASSPVAMVWSEAEIGVALLISSSPILRPVFDRVFKRWISSFRSTGSKTDPSKQGKAGSLATHPMASRRDAKQASVTKAGFLVMEDDNAYELDDVRGARTGGQTGQKSWCESSSASADESRDSTDKIFVRTEIAQSTR